ncbi:unnamed protein product [Symbiodinium natans]|uniref:Microsomal glutathione S-transferase 1 n=1 Tax=Symbiodinium natans TaxID=878477 RepID=A0A812VEY5_9DINO|nr:unnamed protein product [Symbiodinium natans]
MSTVGEVFQTCSIVSVTLFLKYFVTNLRWGFLKGKANMRAREDFNNNENATSDDVERATAAGRIVQNDLENIPFGLILMWGTALCILGAQMSSTDASSMCTAHIVLSGLFTTARVCHTIVYMLHLALPRGAIFMIGTSSLFGLGILGIIAAFEISI